MRAKTFTVLAVLAFAAACFAAPPTLKLPDELAVPTYSFGRLKAEGDFEFISWKQPKGLKIERLSDREFLFTGSPGTYTFEAVASSKEGITGFERTLIVIGDGRPTPEPDVKPNPDVKPRPEPEPPVGDIPFAGVSGLHVLIVYESADLQKYLPSQLSVMYGKKVRDYLAANCAITAGGRKAWNIWDKDIDASGMGKLWTDALSRKRDSLPWLIASNGKKAVEIPLPKTEDDMLKTLEGVK